MIAGGASKELYPTSFALCICAPTGRLGDDVARVVDVVGIVARGADHDVGASVAIEQVRSRVTTQPVVAGLTAWAVRQAAS